MADPFERIVRSPLEYSFDNTEAGQYAQQIVKEMETVTNILVDATYMPASEDSIHIGKRDEESVKETAVGLASDEGDAFSGNGHTVEYETRLGIIGDGCKYNSIQRRNAKPQDVVEKERKDISDTIEGVNRADAFITVYGNSKALANNHKYAASNRKFWKGLAYYTRKLSDYDAFMGAYDAGNNPFAAMKEDDLCFVLDNHRNDATTYAEGKFSSIYAVVWDINAVSKLYPNSGANLGIETEIYEPGTVVYNPKDDASAQRLYKEGYITFRKSSGVNVHNRFGLIRLANIQFDETSESQQKAEYRRLVENMALIETIMSDRGFSGKVKYYASSKLLRQMRIARYLDGQPGVHYTDTDLSNLGQRHGLVGAPFILNDGTVITPDPQILTVEKAVTLKGTL